MAWKNQEEKIECSLVGKKSIVLSLGTQYKVELLMQEYTHQEWMGYLVGKIQKNHLFAEDLVIPPHASASGGEAEAEPFSTPEDCIGVIHSHHTMGAFHSGKDQSHVDANYPCSITVAKQGGELKWAGVCKAQTPCGKSLVRECPVQLVKYKPDFDTNTWLEEAKTNIEKGKRSVVVYDPISGESCGYSGSAYPNERDYLYNYNAMEAEALGRWPQLRKILGYNKGKKNK